MYKFFTTLFFLFCFSAAWAESTFHFAHDQELTKSDSQDDDFGKEKDEIDEVLYDEQGFTSFNICVVKFAPLLLVPTIKYNTKLTLLIFDVVSPPPELY